MSPTTTCAARLRIATWNLYLGADLTSILVAADAAGLGRATAAAVAQAGRTRFPDRARVIADVIAEARPDVIGLQEVVRWKVRRGDGYESSWNHLDLILEALESIGETYVLLFCSDTFSGELAMDNGGVLEFTNCDAMLLRTSTDRQISVLDAGEGHFEARLTVPVSGGNTIEVKRGWVHADLETDGVRVRVMATHLDSVSSAIRLAQSHELLKVASPSPYPTVLVGDFNTDVDDGVVELVTRAGFEDAWDEETRGPGATWGRTPDLDTDAPLRERLDYVFVDPDHVLVEGVEIVGSDHSARTPTEPQVWASDHACVLAEVTIT